MGREGRRGNHILAHGRILSKRATFPSLSPPPLLCQPLPLSPLPFTTSLPPPRLLSCLFASPLSSSLPLHPFTSSLLSTSSPIFSSTPLLPPLPFLPSFTHSSPPFTPWSHITPKEDIAGEGGAVGVMNSFPPSSLFNLPHPIPSVQSLPITSSEDNALVGGEGGEGEGNDRAGERQ